MLNLLVAAVHVEGTTSFSTMGPTVSCEPGETKDKRTRRELSIAVAGVRRQMA